MRNFTLGGQHRELQLVTEELSKVEEELEELLRRQHKLMKRKKVLEECISQQPQKTQSADTKQWDRTGNCREFCCIGYIFHILDNNIVIINITPIVVVVIIRVIITVLIITEHLFLIFCDLLSHNRLGEWWLSVPSVRKIDGLTPPLATT